MAENESLDLGNPGGQRWNQFHDAVKKGMSSDDAAAIAQRKLPAALRKAFKEFAELGVPFDQMMAARNDSKVLARLVRKCDGHEYAHLFAEVAASEPSSSNQELVHSFLNAIVERVSDQVSQSVAGTANWSSIPKVREFLVNVRKHLELDMQRISKKLAKDPSWSPTRRSSKKTEQSNATQQLLNMSLLGINKK